MNVTICPMTRELCHEFYKGFQNDPAIGHYYEYVYTPELADSYFEKNSVPEKKLFAILVDGEIVGECKLKNIDFEKRECSMGIHLQNDAVKEKGYGTQAERLILQYAFEVMGMDAVNADAVLKNTRSQHVLEKAGFCYTHEDETFKYYRCEKEKTMTIRNLTDADYAAVLALYEELDRIHYESRPDYFGKRDCCYPKDAYDECLNDADTLMLGAFEDDKILGTVRATLWNKSGMIEGIKTVCLDNIYVLPEARRKGIAKALFVEVETWARQQGAVRLDLHVWDFNKNALALYRAMGMDYQYHVMEKKL